MNEKEIIRLRRKRIQSGESLYLDSYFKGKRRYEFLRLYLIPERTKADKLKNEQTLRLANTIKSKRLVELFNNKYGFSNEKPEVNLIQYIRLVMENKEKQGKTGIKSTFETLIYHLTKYRGERILLSDLDDRYTKGFVLYLSTAISRTSGKTLKTSSQHNIYTSLKTIVHQAIKDDLLTTDPTKSIDPPRMILPHKEFLTEEELKRLIQTPCSKEIVKRSFLFCCFTGLRISDVRELTWKKVIVEEQGVHINYRQKKTKIENYVPLSENAISVLPPKDDKSDSDRVFTLPPETTIRKTLKEWMTNAKIDKHITFHSSRHTCATLLLNSGVDIYTVKEILGHTDIGTTMKYTKVINKTKRIAVNKIPNLYSTKEESEGVSM